MRTHESVAAMAGAYAEQAVEEGRRFQVQLDYSENSLMKLEGILAQLAIQDPATSQVDELCKMWGSYLGEVVRRRFGGDWSVETYPGKEFATLTLNVGTHKLFPSMKIHRRLTQGEDDNIWSFYKMIKARLEEAPGARVQ